MLQSKTATVVDKLLAKYSKDDYKLIYDTVDMLCAKGISNGCYQDMSVLLDVLNILTAFEEDVKNLEG